MSMTAFGLKRDLVDSYEVLTSFWMLPLEDKSWLSHSPCLSHIDGNTQLQHQGSLLVIMAANIIIQQSQAYMYSWA